MTLIRKKVTYSKKNDHKKKLGNYRNSVKKRKYYKRKNSCKKTLKGGTKADNREFIPQNLQDMIEKKQYEEAKSALSNLKDKVEFEIEFSHMMDNRKSQLSSWGTESLNYTNNEDWSGEDKDSYMIFKMKFDVCLNTLVVQAIYINKIKNMTFIKKLQNVAEYYKDISYLDNKDISGEQEESFGFFKNDIMNFSNKINNINTNYNEILDSLEADPQNLPQNQLKIIDIQPIKVKK